MEIKEDKDICSIKSNGKDFDMVYFFWGKAEGSKTFYGPAQNAEEAEAILAELYKDQGQ